MSKCLFVHVCFEDAQENHSTIGVHHIPHALFWLTAVTCQFVDGMKPGQRKILYAAFKRNLRPRDSPMFGSGKKGQSDLTPEGMAQDQFEVSFFDHLRMVIARIELEEARVEDRENMALDVEQRRKIAAL